MTKDELFYLAFSGTPKSPGKYTVHDELGDALEDAMEAGRSRFVVECRVLFPQEDGSFEEDVQKCAGRIVAFLMSKGPVQTYEITRITRGKRMVAARKRALSLLRYNGIISVRQEKTPGKGKNKEFIELVSETTTVTPT